MPGDKLMNENKLSKKMPDRPPEPTFPDQQDPQPVPDPASPPMPEPPAPKEPPLNDPVPPEITWQAGGLLAEDDIPE